MTQQREASLASAPRHKAQVICGCLEVGTRDVETWIRTGCDTAEKLCRLSGAASHCGSCMQALTNLVGDPGGAPCRFEVEQLGQRLLRVTVRPEGGGAFVEQHLPGQHAVLSVRDAQGWVSRPYTITSEPEQRDARVFLVRPRSGGRMVGALLAAEGACDARLGAPRGDAFARLRSAREVVFVVAGVGMTPALAALAARHGPDVRCVEAYVRASDDRVERLLVEACAARGVPLHVHHTQSESVGADEVTTTEAATALSSALVSQEAFADLARAHPDADFFLCGPRGFERLVRRGLAAGGCSSRCIHVERFLVASDGSAAPPARERSDEERRWSRVGLWLAALWCIWAAMPAVPAWNALQSVYAWRVTTGALVLAVLAWQWMFPLARARGRFALAKKLELPHRAVGALSPVVLLLHQRGLGHGLLSVLSLLWIANTVIGCLDKTVVADADKRDRYMRVWLPTHVIVSIMVTALAAWHVFMILTYRGGPA